MADDPFRTGTAKMGHFVAFPRDKVHAGSAGAWGVGRPSAGYFLRLTPSCLAGPDKPDFRWRSRRAQRRSNIAHDPPI